MILFINERSIRCFFSGNIEDLNFVKVKATVGHPSSLSAARDSGGDDHGGGLERVGGCGGDHRGSLESAGGRGGDHGGGLESAGGRGGDDGLECAGGRGGSHVLLRLPLLRRDLL